MVSFGEKLRRLRVNKNLTQIRVGKFLGISSKAISRYENDKAEPGLDLIIKFAKLYEVDFNYLFDYKTPSSYTNSNLNYYITNDDILSLNKKDRELLKGIIKSTLDSIKSNNVSKIDNLQFVSENDDIK